jgi:protocatechuate 3,4-dioxygenase beta subunit
VALAAGAGAGAGALGIPRRVSGRPLPACIARPEQTEGPYFVDERLNRSDIRSDPSNGAISAGTPLALALLVSRVANGECAPLPGAQVDLWQCDAMGVYSNVEDRTFRTVGQRFLRGYQMTDEEGRVSFRTIYPGWYQGRTVHIHFKIRVPESGGRAQEFTSQIYFDDALTDRVHAVAPYTEHEGRRTLNSADGIFRSGGSRLVMATEPDGDGYRGQFEVGLQMG